MEMQIQIENLDKYYGKKTRSGPCEPYNLSGNVRPAGQKRSGEKLL